ncbi:uncharacterized protein LOC106011274 [Aplysia californica]|uniref:Uncharacterized protein LOC106011274 n=1 Tax=Aplysia californica TaxID=6500 RepID=A0ABM1VQK0_APLCA|nr:uncharacterized protein LOC106011274 [Aplysia californica]
MVRLTRMQTYKLKYNKNIAVDPIPSTSPPNLTQQSMLAECNMSRAGPEGVGAVPTNDSVDDSGAAQVSQLVKYYVMDIAVPFICAMALTDYFKSGTYKHFNNISLSFLFLSQSSFQDVYEEGDSMLYFDFVANGLITVFIISSTWLIVVMAAERYIAVCHPLRARKLISLRRTRISIIVVFFICVMATIPIFLERRIDAVSCPDGRRVYRLVQRSEDSVKVRRILWAVCFDFIPCAALVYFNLCLILQIRKAKRLRDEMAPKHAVLRYESARVCLHPKDCRNSDEESGMDNNGTAKHTDQTKLSNKTYIGRGRSPHQQQQQSQKQQHNRQVGRHQFRASGPRSAASGRYSHFVAFANGKEKSSKSSSGLHSSHTDGTSSADSAYRPTVSQRQELNRNGRTVNFREGGTSRFGAMAVSSSGSSVMKKRPSDSALNSVTATLVAVVILFLILVSPSELLKFSVGYALTDSHQKKVVTYVTNFMQVLNFSLNFVLYCAVNKTFRHTLKGLICCCWLSIRR